MAGGSEKKHAGSGGPHSRRYCWRELLCYFALAVVFAFVAVNVFIFSEIKQNMFGIDGYTTLGKFFP